MTNILTAGREALIEAMARAVAAENHATLIWEFYLHDVRTALDVAERAGWRLVPPEDGR